MHNAIIDIKANVHLFSSVFVAVMDVYLFDDFLKALQ